jgi:hypothetical protein
MVAFITSPIDTLLQPPTRARAPSRTCTAVASQPLKSNSRFDLRVTNLTTDTRWGFCSRDPVIASLVEIYEYCRSNPFKYIDFSGNCPIVIPFVVGGAAVVSAGEAVALGVGLSVLACLAHPPCRDAMLQAISDAVDAMSAAAKAALRVACAGAHASYKAIELTCSGCLPKKGKTCVEQMKRCIHAGINAGCWESAIAGRLAYVMSGCDFVWPSDARAHIGQILQKQITANNCLASAANNCWQPIVVCSTR